MSHIERVFIGWDRPALIGAVDVLQTRFLRGDVWDMTSVLLVVPGKQAGRRLRQIIEQAAARASVTLTGLSDPVTPADLLERLFTPERPVVSAWQARFAWMHAARRLYTDQTARHLMSALAPRLTDPEGVTAWTGVAAEAQRLRETVAAECLSLTDLAGQGSDRRWEALARMETTYRAVLAEAGLSDRDDARRTALAHGEVNCSQMIFLVAIQDLNGLERAMLTALPSPVCALIPAPESERDGFDETSRLQIDHWADAPLPIPEDRLCFVEGPAEEANALKDQIAALKDDYARDQITVGVGDISGAEALARRLAVSGLSTASPFGRPLARVGPGALLGLVRDALHDNGSVRRFAALIRHPDLEVWLEAETLSDDAQSWPEAAREMAERPILHCLDCYRTECLVEHLPATPRHTPVTALDAARLRVLTARDRVEALLAPMRDGSRPLPSWAGPIAALLRIIYGEEPSGDDTPDTRQSRRAMTGLAGVLQNLRSLPSSLAPIMTGAEALAFVCAEAETIFLPSDPSRPAMAMHGWLDLALDDAPVLLLTGLHEGNVPAGTGDDALLPESLRRNWGLADDRRRQARDAWLLRLMLETRTHLQIVVTRRGADGSPKMPSRLLFACDGPTAARRAQAFAVPSPDESLTRPLFAPGGERRLPPARPEPSAVEITSLKVTAFRDYLTCPYRFYLRHVLRLDETGDHADELEPRAFGNLLHPCLEDFAGSPAADSTDPARIAAFLRDALERRCRLRFGAQTPTPVRLQIRQAGLRLDAFAHWQAQSARDGWQIQNDLAEREMDAALEVDRRPFVIRGRLDRVDYHPATDRFRIIDYKTGDSGASPEDKHRSAAEGGRWAWIDLQLPLYRTLLAAQGFAEDAIEVGYILLASDLNPVSISQRGKASGGIGFVDAHWTDADYRSAQECAAAIVRKLRAGVFWPPSEPPRFTDPFSGLCLDVCSDREEWFDLSGGER